MATVSERVRESTIGAGRRRWTALLGRLPRGSLWLVVAAYLVVYAVLLVGAASAALYLGAILPGAAGAVVFLTVGLVLVATAPTATRILFVRIFTAYDVRTEP